MMNAIAHKKVSFSGNNIIADRVIIVSLNLLFHSPKRSTLNPKPDRTPVDEVGRLDGAIPWLDMGLRA